MSFFDYKRFNDEKYFFRIQKLGWMFIGFWPGSDNIQAYQVAIAVINLMEVLIYGVFQINFCYVNRENLILLLDAMTPLFAQLFTAIKALIVVWKRDKVKIILDHLKQSFIKSNDQNLYSELIYCYHITNG